MKTSLTLHSVSRSIGAFGLAICCVSSLAIVRPAVAAPMNTSTTIDFTSTGWIGANPATNPGIMTGPVSFQGVTGGILTAPSAFGLGEFQVAPLPATVSVSYNNTPFQVTLALTESNGPPGMTTNVTIDGYLNGTLSGSNQSTVIASVASILPTGPTLSTPMTPNLSLVTPLGDLNVPFSLALVPASSGGGMTSFQADFGATPVPEPSTLAFFAMAFGGIGLWRKRGVKRNVSA
jgi:hypothetical protein